MAITKPSWLRQLLGRLNWDIFTWKVYVGDAIEQGIDWALGWINWGIDQAGRAFNKAVAAFDYAVDLGRNTLAVIYREVDRIQSSISTWWSDLSEWWGAKLQDIKDRIQAARDWLQDRIDEAQQTVNKMLTAWDGFRTGILPGLLNTTWIRDFFGRGVSTIADWWAPRHREISEEIDAEVTPVRDEVNKHTTWLDLVKELFTDPEKWLLDMIERTLARFW
jgi:hypothetical protein